ncbi:hypothetical protein AB0N81_18015 [Streptomyces sp. NPDC093510]|uniref:hypothetical protein n=1 Tax=Streptomyces sp. NPDC093510 TaxID=3155199 RepID=UPI003437521D
MRQGPGTRRHRPAHRIEYTGVTHFSVDYEASIDWMEAITVLLAEALPHEEGVVHRAAPT